MKLTFILLTVGFLNVSANGVSQTVSYSGENVPLKSVFQAVKKQTGFVFLCTGSVLQSAHPVTVIAKEIPLEMFLKEIFRSQPLKYSITGKSILVSEKQTELVERAARFPELYPDSIPKLKITGTVMGFNGQMLPGATIRVKGKNETVASNNQGTFEIMVQPGSVLLVSYAGYMAVEQKINTSQDMVLKLEPNAVLEEAIVSNGYQRIQQKHLTGSVTSLKMDSIMQPGLTSIDKMLEGRVPGMIMMQNSGQAGSVPKLRIRGTSTVLGSREPLWVLDGIVLTDPVNISSNSLNDPDFVNLVGNAISGLNPNDIESIDVLKDAAATALYGVRAANGVIVVTTKRGVPGPPTINYSTSLNYTRRPRYTDKEVYMMNSQDRVDVSREMIDRQLLVKGVPEAYEKAVIDYYKGNIDYDTYYNRVYQAERMNTDWLGVVTHDVLNSNHSLGISGGNDASRYYASIGYTDERGVLNGEFNKRYTGQVKYDIHYKNFKAQFGIMANKNNRNYIPQVLGILNYAYGTSRAIPLYKEDGSLYYYATSDNGGTVFSRSAFNVLNEMQHSGQTVDGSSYIATANLNYQIISGLQLETILSYSSSNTEQRTWFDEKTNWVEQIKGYYTTDIKEVSIPYGGELQQQTSGQKGYTLRTQANLSRFLDAGSKHLLNATVGGEFSSSSNNDLTQTRRGYYPDRGNSFAQIDLLTYTGYAIWLSNAGQAKITENLNNLASAYATFSYIYNDRYVFSANTRSDYSNAFGMKSNKRFLPTWGASARWNLDKDVLKNVQWIDLASLRFSYGTQGNMLPGQTPNVIIEKGLYNSLYQNFGSTIAYFSNPSLKWEKTDAYNVALDFSLLKNRLNGTIGFFYKRTENAFLNMTVSLVNGVSTYVVNGGTLENKGAELSFNFTPVKTFLGNTKKALIWRIDPQLGQVFNKLLDRAMNKNSESILIDPNNTGYSSWLKGNISLNGKAINTFYSYRFKGLNNQGVPVFYGAELERVAELTQKYNDMSSEAVIREVMVESGKREPVVQGGVSNYLAYGSWSLNFMVTYSLGNKIRLMQLASGKYGTYRPSSQQNLRREFVDRWHNPGDELKTNIPGLSPLGTSAKWWDLNSFAQDYYQMYDFSDLRVVSGDYIKLQSVALNYTCSPEFCRTLGVKAARISLAGSNLYTWAHKELRGQDPNQSGASPDINLGIRPVYVAALNVSF